MNYRLCESRHRIAFTDNKEIPFLLGCDHYCSTHPGYDSQILDSGYSVNQTWIGLGWEWHYNDLRGLEKYANIIHKLQGELSINKTKFYNAYTYDEDDVEID